jgi:hypothetical protein
MTMTFGGAHAGFDTDDGSAGALHDILDSAECKCTTAKYS